MTCLTVTPAAVDEAISGRAELIVTHHPLPFAAVKRLTSDTVVGRMLLKLIAAGVAVYSPHTAFDSAAAGINQRLAEGLGSTDIRPSCRIRKVRERVAAGRSRERPPWTDWPAA